MYVKLDSNNRVTQALGIIPDGDDPENWEYCNDSLMQGGRLIKADGVIRSATPEELAAELTELQATSAARRVRFQRDELLAAADKYTQLDRWEGFTAAQKASITAYKQALRDVTTQAGFPLTVTWPTEPTL